jgi:probable rRNA maturation factor
MSLSITIRNRQRPRAVDVRLMRQITKTLLGELLQVEQAELGIFLVAAPEMTRLNESFLRHAGSTDVITFDYSVAADVRRLTTQKQSEPPYVGCYEALNGEIFICVDEAIVQARRFRTTWQAEVVRYVVHGILHLLGHDDTQAAIRRKMKREENRLLRLLASRFAFGKLSR